MIIAIFNSAGIGFPESDTVLLPRTVVVAVLVGVGITLLSVIIPARNEADRLPLLLESLRTQSRPPDEIVVVDDHSTDDTATAAAAEAVAADLRGCRDALSTASLPTVPISRGRG